jgi:hypothetical protein
MGFQWPDPTSLFADLVTVFGIPILFVSTRKFYADFRKERAARKAEVGVSTGCLEFFNLHQHCAINLVPLEQMTVLPRHGDHVYLPGDGPGACAYEVEGITFLFDKVPDVDQPCSAALSKVVASVQRLRPPKLGMEHE